MKKRPKITIGIGLLLCFSILIGINSFNKQSNVGNTSQSLREKFLEKARNNSTPIRSASVLNEHVALLKDERDRFDQTVWSEEVAAQEYEQTIVKYWDQMLQPEDDKYAVLAKFPFKSITLDSLGDVLPIEWGIKRIMSGGKGKTLNREEWRKFLTDMQSLGYKLDAIEFHQASYEDNPGGTPVSIFSTLLNVMNEDDSKRWQIKSKLRIEWTDNKDEDGRYIPGDMTLFDTTILEREGSVVFEHSILEKEFTVSSHPIAYDLNQDGFSEILLPSNNIILWNRGDGQFDKREAFSVPGRPAPKLIFTTTLADFDGDGNVDMLCSGQFRDLLDDPMSIPENSVFLFRGDNDGAFTRPGIQAAPSTLELVTPKCSTAGDIDGDGDLDVWIAQYRDPYMYGQMPTPFYDANDGYPSYLLLNNGDGTFEEATESAGLSKKRFRRTFAASFVDLDQDLDLDLLVTSDFSGSDVYLNDGTGHFTDQTKNLLDESTNFGMGHAIADFNQDGNLDFFVTGMGSTTMRRLNQMGLTREDHPEFLEMRTRMGYGNRMYMAQDDQSFAQPNFKDSVARSGWAWGTTAFDFDSDGDSDIYITNGHQSGESTKDYCTQYWCHDVYTGTSEVNTAISYLFKDTAMGVTTRKISWDGHQKNHLYMNQSGKDFVNIGFLMNAGQIDDSRSTLSDDFNGDGHPDLLFTSRYIDRQTAFEKLHLLMNQWPIENNWIGVRLQIEAGGPSTLGAKIRLQSKSNQQLGFIVAGDSFSAQHAPMKHFGLGADNQVDFIEIQWPNGAKQRVEAPEINKYHTFTPSTAH